MKNKLSSNKNNSFSFLFDHSNFASFLHNRLTSVFSDELQLDKKPLHVEIFAPNESTVVRHLQINRTLKAKLTVSWENSTQSISFSFPYPVHGVFIYRSNTSKNNQAEKWIWHPRLTGKPGIWFLDKHFLNKKEKKQITDKPTSILRLVYPGGIHYDIGHRTPSTKKQLFNLAILKSYGEQLAGSNKELLDRLTRYVDTLWEKIREPNATVDSLEQYITENSLEDVFADDIKSLPSSPAGLLDEQDIRWQRLYTYSAYLLNEILSLFMEKKRQFFLSKKKSKTEDSLWDALCELNGNSLVTAKLRKDLLERGQFHFFAPVNGLEALSRLTSFQKYNYKSDALERLPARYRQNHPSFQGFICPVESPESKKVGLTLNLSRNVRTDVMGCLHLDNDNVEPDHHLGFGASLVPFYQLNDGPRAMMGAKNLKQAVPIRGAQNPCVKTGAENEALQVVRPLADSGIIPACPAVAPGIDLLVAYMPWYGWNMEDAIVANSRLTEKGILDWETSEVFFKRIKPGFILVKPEFKNTFEEAFKTLCYDDNNLRKPGFITPDTPIAFFRNVSTGEMHPIPCGGDNPGELAEIEYNTPSSPFLGGTLRWSVRRTSPLMVGDKLMGRYGNKGVVSRLLPAEEMPRLPEDPRLPENLYGRPVDLILNPHGVISRMNLGQLLETQIGLFNRLSPEHFSTPDNTGKAFTTLQLDQFTSVIGKINGETEEPLIDRYGRIRLLMPDGNPPDRKPEGTKRPEQTTAPVTVGFQHIVRLRHVAKNKAQVRGSYTHRPQLPHNLITGQPVGGKRRKGGQRLGEMEIWALASNQVSNFIQGALTTKSDPSLNNEHLPQGQTFQAIKDHLFAMGVTLQQDEEGKAHLQFNSVETVIQSAKEITNPKMWSIGTTGEFRCSMEDCNYQYPRSVVATGRQQRSKDNFLTLSDVLKDHGLYISEETEQTIPSLPEEGVKKEISGEIKITLATCGENAMGRKINLYFSRKKRSLHLGLTLANKKYTAYKQVEKDIGEIPVSKVTNTPLTCPKHTTNRLKCEQKRPALIPKEDGLCDEAIFGNIDISDWKAGSGGYIRIPRAAVMNLDSIFQETASETREDGESQVSEDITGEPEENPAEILSGNEGQQDTLPKKLSNNPLFTSLRAQSASEEYCFLPILPHKYRYERPELRGGNIARLKDKFNRTYSRLLMLSTSEEENDNTIKGITFHLIHLSKLLSNRLFGKFGLIRRDGLGRRVDMSGRLVIVPDPTLGWDSCGVPTEILTILLGPQVAAEPNILRDYLQLNSVADDLVRELFGPILSQPGMTKEVESEVLNSSFWSNSIWPDKKRTKEHLQLAHEVLEYYLHRHPETTVLLNRQPSLHRYSMMGFHPVPLPPGEGLVLKINPLVCKGFGADFDGDEMTIHMPLTKEEMAEIEGMKPTKRENIFSMANGEPMANFDQDFVCGHFFISLDPETRQSINRIFPTSSCPECRKILEAQPPWKKQHGQTLLKHLCESHPEDLSTIIQQWMALAFETITENGLSFGFLELDAIRKKLSQTLAPTVEQALRTTEATELKQQTDTLGKKVLDELENITVQPVETPGYGFASLALSGARGFKQTRQLVGCRGLLSPGDTGFEYSPKSFFIPQSLVEGMTPDSAFMAAMNARSSMVDKKLGTGLAGYLTRRLVLILWDWIVQQGDCGQTTPGRPIDSCLWKDKKYICSTCYRKLPGYDSMPDNFPAGLIAAQSFGERGTQLSMQSFHTAEKQLSIDDVVALLGGRDPVSNNKNWFKDKNDAERFIERIKSESAYEKIDERHIRLIWLAIHLSPQNTLSSAWNCNKTPISGLAGFNQTKALMDAVKNAAFESFNSPVANVITSQAPVRTAEEGGHE